MLRRQNHERGYHHIPYHEVMGLPGHYIPNGEPTMLRHIYVRKDQIMADIDIQIDMATKARRTEQDTEDGPFNNATERYAGQFARWIDQSVGIVKGALSAYLAETERTARMNSISTVEELDFELHMPSYWEDTVFDSLSQAVHRYIVNNVLYEFFVLSLTSKDPLTMDKMAMTNEALLDLKRFANAAKPGMVHKVLKPF